MRRQQGLVSRVAYRDAGHTIHDAEAAVLQHGQRGVACERVRLVPVPGKAPLVREPWPSQLCRVRRGFPSSGEFSEREAVWITAKNDDSLPLAAPSVSISTSGRVESAQNEGQRTRGLRKRGKHPGRRCRGWLGEVARARSWLADSWWGEIPEQELGRSIKWVWPATSASV